MSWWEKILVILALFMVGCWAFDRIARVKSTAVFLLAYAILVFAVLTILLYLLAS